MKPQSNFSTALMGCYKFEGTETEQISSIRNHTNMCRSGNSTWQIWYTQISDNEKNIYIEVPRTECYYKTHALSIYFYKEKFITNRNCHPFPN